MPSFEHVNSPPKAREDENYRPGEEAAEEETAPHHDKSIGLGQNQLSWSDLAKEPDPEETEERGESAHADESESAPDAAPQASENAGDGETEFPVAVESPAEAAKPQRIDDSHFPDPGPSLLQNTVSKPAGGSSRKRNRPATGKQNALPAGHPGLVESPAAFEEKLSGRFAEGKPEPRRKPAAKPAEESAKQSGDPEQRGEEGSAPSKPKRKRKRNRNRKPREGETAQQQSGQGETPTAESGKPRGEGRRAHQSKTQGAGKPAAKAPESKGLVGAVKKFFRSIVGGEEAKAQAKPEATGKPEQRGQRLGEGQKQNRGPKQERGQGDHRSNREGGDRPPRRRGKRGGRNRRQGQRQNQGKGQGPRRNESPAKDS